MIPVWWKELTLDVLLTRLEVRMPNGYLYAGFRGLGGIFFPGYEHWFPSEVLGNKNNEQKAMENARLLHSKIKKTPELDGCSKKGVKNFWWIYQVKTAIKNACNLPSYVKGSKDRPHFIKGHYTQQARWNLTAPGRLVTLGEPELEALGYRRDLEQMLSGLRQDFSDSVKPGVFARRWNELERYVFLDKISEVNGVDTEFLERRIAIESMIREFNAGHTKFEICYDPFEKDWRKRRVRLFGEDYSFLKNSVPMPEDYWLKRSWLFIDLETPWWKQKDYRIPWIGMRFISPSADEKVIYTAYDLGVDNVGGYKIMGFTDIDEMNIAAADLARELDPDIISAWNANFDLLRWRESSSGFPIGEDLSNPFMEANKHFFERYGIKDRFVIDPMRWHKIARHYAINAKLETGAGFKKEESYSDLEENEALIIKAAEVMARAGDTTDDEKKALEEGISRFIRSAEYLAMDVDNVAGFLSLDEFRHDVNDAALICDHLNLSLQRLLHTVNSVNDAQERGYFEHCGLYRDNMPPYEKYEEKIKDNQRARDFFIDDVVAVSLNGERKGLSRDVVKAMIPVSGILRDVLCKRMDKARQLYRWKDERRGDKKRLFFWERVMHGLCRWIIEDYGKYSMALANLDEMIGSVDVAEFQQNYKRLRQILKVSSKPDLWNLDKHILAAASVDEHIDDDMREWIYNHGISVEKFTKMVNQRSKVKRIARRFLGNYDVYTSRRFFEDDKLEEDAVVMDEILSLSFERIDAWLKENGLEIVAHEHEYVYVKGNTDALFSEDAMLVPCDKIDALYNADKAYYSKFGYYSHISFKQEAGFRLCRFEMETYERMLEALLQGNDQQAEQIMKESLSSLSSVPDEKLYLYNKSGEYNFAYVKGKRFNFVLSSDYSGEFQTDKDGNRFFMHDPDSDKDKKKKRKPVKVFVVDSVELDLQFYWRRIKDRTKAMLSPSYSGK